MLKRNMNIADYDPVLWQTIQDENRRQEEHIELIASENYASPRVMEAQGSQFTNKYAEGYPGKRYYGGCEYADIVEQLAIDRAKELFGADYANVQPHSGSQANAAVYMALLNPGDTILGMSLAHGGHLTHGASVSFSGKIYHAEQYGITAEGLIDYDALRKQALEVKPKMIVGGFSAYSQVVDWKKMREIADEVGAYLMVDMAHIAGLCATGHHQNPVEYAHIVTTTTHKTLRGPRGGVILAKEEFGKKLNSAVFPGIQCGPLEHVVAAKAVSFFEAATPEYTEYIGQVIKNAQAMADVFNASDLRVISGGTDNHLLLLDVTSSGLNGKQVEKLLDTVEITVNKNTIPFETLGANKASGIRIGTPAITTRGLKEAEARKIAELIVETIQNHTDEAKLDEIRAAVHAITKAFPLHKKPVSTEA